MSSAETAGKPPQQKRRSRYAYRGLIPLWIAVFVDILGFSILIPFLPFFSQAYGAPPWQVGLLLSTNALFSFFSGPTWGSLSDKYGRKPMLLISQAGTLAGFVMLAFSRNLPMLFLSRIVDGIFGGNYPIAKAIIGDVVPPKDRSVEMSNIGVAHVLSSLIGPAVGGMLSRWGIMAPGLLSAGLTVITITVTLLYLRESNPVVATKGAMSEPGGTPGPAAPPKRPTATRLGILRNPDARYLLIQWGLHTLSFSTYVSSISLFANLKLGLNAEQIGQLLMLAGMVRVFIRFVVFVPMRRRLGDRVTSLIGLSLFVGTYLFLGFVRNPVEFGIVLCLASFAASCSRGILTSFLSRSVKPWEQGTTMGLSASLDSLAQITGPLIGGVVLGSLPHWVYGSIASAFALGALLMGVRRLACHEQPAVARLVEGELAV